MRFDRRFGVFLSRNRSQAHQDSCQFCQRHYLATYTDFIIWRVVKEAILCRGFSTSFLPWEGHYRRLYFELLCQECLNIIYHGVPRLVADSIAYFFIFFHITMLWRFVCDNIFRNMLNIFRTWTRTLALPRATFIWWFCTQRTTKITSMIFNTYWPYKHLTEMTLHLKFIFLIFH